MQGQALPGFRDFYPEDLAFRNTIFATWREVARRYGFQEYDGPPLEPLELYTAKSGAEIVQQLYAFEDKGGRKVALRPEMTPTLARMVGARAQALKKPIRWFSIPQLFRYERQQRGRLREHFQLNMDIIGEAGPAADAELIAAAIDIMRAFGLGAEDVRLRLSDRRVLTSLLRKHPQFQGERVQIAFEVLDKIERQGRSETERRLREAQFDAAAIERLFEIASLKGLEAVQEELRSCPDGPAAGESLVAVTAGLGAMGLSDFIEIDLTVVRGLAYYTGVVFELFDRGKELRAICGGGRYDSLIQEVAGIDLPCVGFGMGDVVLGELLRERHQRFEAPGQLDAFLVAVGGEDVAPVLRLAAQLRERGVAAEYALRNQPIRKQLELAAARGAPRAVIIGPDERKAKVAVVRDLKTGKQRKVSLTKVRKGVFK